MYLLIKKINTLKSVKPWEFPSRGGGYQKAINRPVF